MFFLLKSKINLTNETKTYYFLILFVLPSLLFAANKNENFKVDNNIMVVTYDLVNCPNGKIYDVNLKIIGDSGIYVPKSVSGDLENVNPRKNKKIEWNMPNDNSKIKNNIQAIVEITKIHSNAIKDKQCKPKSCFKSR